MDRQGNQLHFGSALGDGLLDTTRPVLELSPGYENAEKRRLFELRGIFTKELFQIARSELFGLCLQILKQHLSH